MSSQQKPTVASHSSPLASGELKPSAMAQPVSSSGDLPTCRAAIIGSFPEPTKQRATAFTERFLDVHARGVAGFASCTKRRRCCTGHFAPLWTSDGRPKCPHADRNHRGTQCAHYKAAAQIQAVQEGRFGSGTRSLPPHHPARAQSRTEAPRGSRDPGHRRERRNRGVRVGTPSQADEVGWGLVTLAREKEKGPPQRHTRAGRIAGLLSVRPYYGSVNFTSTLEMRTSSTCVHIAIDGSNSATLCPSPSPLA